jgi:hypothetical protein
MERPHGVKRAHGTVLGRRIDRIESRTQRRRAYPLQLARALGPEHEILRQYRIMRRFQEHETKCRQALREEFGFEFIEPPARIL